MIKIGGESINARTIGSKRVVACYIGGELIFSEPDPWYIMDSLANHYDLLNNTGNGFDPTSTVWADLVGGADMTLHNVSFGLRSLVFAGNADAKGVHRGVDVETFTMFSTHRFPDFTGLVHPRIFGENPFPTLYARSNRGYAYAYYGQGIDTDFAPQYIPPLNRIMRTAIRWRGAGHPIELFVDGVRVGQVGPTNSYPAKAATKYLGCNSGTTRTLTGEFFEHMVYTKPLEDAEILHNYNVSVRRYGEG